jgi:NAD(P)-dependent dehydrogenase (short-subunit alcohol dehydrogenase family)
MGKVVIITGTTHGIGRVTARELARAGYTLGMLCRNTALADDVRREICSIVPSADIRIFECDLAAMASVRRCAEQVLHAYPAIELLINNAGMVSTRHQRSVDGFEMTFASNHLGPFLLTELLRKHVGRGGRIVNVASRVHYKGTLELPQIDNRRAPYNGFKAYAQSKLANVMHTFALARRLQDTGVTVNCLHPGVVASNLLPRWLKLIKPLISPGMFDNERGAQTTLFLATSNEVRDITGQYFDEHQKIQKASQIAVNVELQEALWRASERWSGLAA